MRADGRVDVLTPQTIEKGWRPYVELGPALGTIFTNERAKLKNNKETRLRLSNEQVMKFVETVFTNYLDAPTIAVVPANWWRDSKGMYDKAARWVQLGNRWLFEKRNKLDFSHGKGTCFDRSDPRLTNLVAVIRLRTTDETPQYSVGILDWDDDKQGVNDVKPLSGYVDCSVEVPIHYFSLAGRPKMQKGQFVQGINARFKSELSSDYAFKHPQLIELVPFFVRDDFAHDEAQRALCRYIHLLRISPAFAMGNLRLPYPTHLAKKLLGDLMDIIEVS